MVTIVAYSKRSVILFLEIPCKIRNGSRRLFPYIVLERRTSGSHLQSRARRAFSSLYSLPESVAGNDPCCHPLARSCLTAGVSFSTFNLLELVFPFTVFVNM